MALLRAPTNAQRRREWAVQNRLRLRFERALFRAISSEIRRAGRAAAEGFETGLDVGVDIALRDHPGRVERILRAHYGAIMPAFGERLFDGAKSLRGSFETKDQESHFTRLVQDWIARFAGRNIGLSRTSRISATTRSQIIDAVLDGQQEGVGIARIAKLIRDKTSGGILRARSLVIARTEVHTSSQASQVQALDALDIPEVKREWVAALDTRTRDTHISANGQTRDQNEPFDVGASKLMHPGDPAGPAAEIISCRCAAIAVIPD